MLRGKRQPYHRLIVPILARRDRYVLELTEGRAESVPVYLLVGDVGVTPLRRTTLSR